MSRLTDALIISLACLCLALTASCDDVNESDPTMDGGMDQTGDQTGDQSNDTRADISGPDEWFACSADADCVLFEAGCCDHCNGGRLVSVNSMYETEARDALRETECTDVACTEIACEIKSPVCNDQGLCSYVGASEACTGLDANACNTSGDCTPILGAPAAEVCVDDLSNWMSVYAGCMRAGLGCGDAETCAVNPSTGRPMVFPDTCIPSDWSGCPSNDGCTVPASCEAGGDAGIGRLCVKPTDTDGVVEFQAQPAGCHSSSCTTTHLAMCEAALGADNAVDVSSIFCLESVSDPNVGCTADCGGGGSATCRLTEVVDGTTYTVTAGDITLTFTPPVDAAGECAGDPFGG